MVPQTIFHDWNGHQDIVSRSGRSWICSWVHHKHNSSAAPFFPAPAHPPGDPGAGAGSRKRLRRSFGPASLVGSLWETSIGRQTQHRQDGKLPKVSHIGRRFPSKGRPSIEVWSPMSSDSLYFFMSSLDVISLDDKQNFTWQYKFLAFQRMRSVESSLFYSIFRFKKNVSRMNKFRRTMSSAIKEVFDMP